MNLLKLTATFSQPRIKTLGDLCNVTCGKNSTSDEVHVSLSCVPVHFRGGLGVDAVGGDGRAMSVEHLLSVIEVNLSSRHLLESLAKFAECT